MAKLFTSVIVGIFNGFTFWQLGYSAADMQDRMFTSFLILLIPPTIVNAVVPKFYQNRALWEARELPSRIYGWVAFCTANVVAEIPIAIVGATIYWALWYWPTGLPTNSSTSGYVYLMTMLFFLFQASWGQICILRAHIPFHRRSCELLQKHYSRDSIGSKCALQLGRRVLQFFFPFK